MATTEVRDLQESNLIEALRHVDRLREVAQMMEVIRGYYCLPIMVGSGYRGRELNRRVKGSKNSAHCRAEACDFNILTMKSVLGRTEILHWIWKESGIKFRQLIIEAGCIHIALPRGDGYDGQVFEYDVNTGKRVWLHKPEAMK